MVIAKMLKRIVAVNNVFLMSTRKCVFWIQVTCSCKFFQSFVPPKYCGPEGSIILEHRSPNALNESRMIPMTHPYDPAHDPSRKGSFDILGDLDFAPGMFNNFIHAHPPSRVRRNVYEFSRLLPDTLKFELVPWGDNWASLFNDIVRAKKI
ncbi:putative flavonoid 3'-monooxygenase-like [Capsicum annuum]|nr:putative flavonoid 3'-monooxygenase-like [Capsicum annuum]